MTVPISMSEFPFYIIEKQFLYNRIFFFLKSKRVSSCHKRKLPGLIKFRKRKTQQNNNNNNNTYRTIHTSNVCSVASVRKTKMKTHVLTLNTGSWSHNRFAARTPAQRHSWREPFTRRLLWEEPRARSGILGKKKKK